MSRVNQTTTADDPQRLGNCVSACVASILNRPLDEVPHFAEEGRLLGDTLDDGENTASGIAWWAMMLGYMAAAGYSPVQLAHVDQAEPGEYLFVAGLSPRGVMHQVIYRDGLLWHDPHPSRDGLVDVREVLAWRPRRWDHTPTPPPVLVEPTPKGVPGA
ncbi:hypothetical protein [Pimelobacter simplex]|uniref:hypothetical protein n=1 Tax=Nocardioides simplex TaxID=2045 RepID=UPI0019311A5E|nr:hypothetical protein [Pimelobacter simplex]